MGPNGATKHVNMNNNKIINIPDTHDKNDEVSLEMLNRKTMSEVEVNNLLEALKYLRLDGENEMVTNLQMNNNKIAGLDNPVEPSDGVNKR